MILAYDIGDGFWTQTVGQRLQAGCGGIRACLAGCRRKKIVGRHLANVG
jgi:hypothetical protein